MTAAAMTTAAIVVETSGMADLDLGSARGPFARSLSSGTWPSRYSGIWEFLFYFVPHSKVSSIYLQEN